MPVTNVRINKGFIGRLSQDELVAVLPFQYNPSETNRRIQANYNFISPPGSPIPTASFKSGNGSQMNLELFFDAVENYDEDKEGLGAHRAFLETLVLPNVEDYTNDLGQFIAPPQALYGLGRDTFKVVVNEVQFREVRRAPNGDVTRMYAVLNLAQYWTDQYELREWLQHLETLRQMVEVDPSSLTGGL